ncbi:MULTISPECIES: CfaE/CblD family pilus tip adhesin [Rahnella]|uniref:CfaE/CblD family pilus tip adhesin n=1 Tax=Rahnella TaxID=34037 RepID=UPI00101C2902|nr:MULTISPECIES: CfaE/CblD family pilus tip adhesin [Rahnella]RYJ16376.1 pilus assembly protein CblD [Rahnella variigena]TCQ90354.1 CblD-like pilus biogenesis initiator [Rahnella sp. JUb53]
MDRKETYFFVTLLLLFSALTITPAKAQRIEPTGRETPVTATFDKSSAPSQIDIWKDESGGIDSDNDSLWGRNTWVCLSSSDPATGQCRTSVTGVQDGNTTIPIVFTEQRSHLTQVINLTGYHNISVSIANGCWSAGVIGGPYQVYAAMEKNCGGVQNNDESLLTVYVTSQEMQKLPFGGIWKAELKMSLMQWSPTIKLADWNAHITLNVTDTNNQQIYLPEFGEAAPRVDLNMRPLPGTGGNQTQMNGAVTIDMCLYDGYGSNSTSFTLKFDDQQQGTKERNNAYFSIYSDHGDVNQDSGRIDYYVRMQAPDGKYMSMIRGEDVVIPDIQTAHIRPVHLPGIPQAVLCIPAPLELSTKTIDINSKQAGHYTGHLIVNFTPQL